MNSGGISVGMTAKKRFVVMGTFLLKFLLSWKLCVFSMETIFKKIP